MLNASKTPQIIFVHREGDSPQQRLVLDWLLNHQPGEVSSIALAAAKLGLLNKATTFIANLYKIFKIRRKYRAESSIFYVSSFAVLLECTIALLGISRNRRIYHSQDWLSRRRFKLRAWIESRFANSAQFVVWNEPHRAVAAWEIMKLRSIPLVIPTYLPSPITQLDRETIARTRSTLLTTATDSKQLPDQICYIFAGGGYSDQRASKALIKAVGLLGSDYKLVFTGRPPSQPSFIDITSNVVWMGRLDYADYLALMASCDLGVLLYDRFRDLGSYYQQPGRLSEFLSLAIPCVASDFADARRIAAATELFEVVDETDSSDIANGIAKLWARIADQGYGIRARLADFHRSHCNLDPFMMSLLDEIRKFHQVAAGAD